MFIPVLFLGGMVGRLLHEFSVTIIVAILISGFVSLTFTPMLGSRYLPPHDRKHGAVYRGLEKRVRFASPAPMSTRLREVLHHRFATMWSLSLMLAGTVYIFMTMPTGFIPSQDSGYILGVSMAGQDISYRVHGRAAEGRRRHHGRRSERPGLAVFLAGEQCRLCIFDDETAQASESSRWTRRSQQLRPKLAEVPGIMTFLQNPPPITINGQFTTSVYQMTLQSVSLKDIYDWTPKLTQKIQTLPGFVDVSSDLLIASPQVRVDIDRDRASVAGRHAGTGSKRALQFVWRPAGFEHLCAGKSVLGHPGSPPEYQRSPDALQTSSIYDPRKGSWCRWTKSPSVVRTVGPLSVNHFGQIPAATVSFNLQPGFSLGEQLKVVNEAVRELRMPASVTVSFQGTVKEFQESFQGLTVLLIVAILVIYIVLGVLYESFIHPITILSGLPSAVFGALLTLVLFHKELDLYAFVGLIMLFGVVKKNAIMMIDFAIEAQRVDGKSPAEAIYQGCILALSADHDDDHGRPIRYAAGRAWLW